jgi:hypothetical protein
MKIILSLIFFLLIFTNCKKSNSNSNEQEVTYEVVLENTTTWYGGYMNETGDIISLTDQKSNWKHSFRRPKNLCCLQLYAYPNGGLIVMQMLY